MILKDPSPIIVCGSNAFHLEEVNNVGVNTSYAFTSVKPSCIPKDQFG
jgi:hypothetical protein